MSHAIRLYPLQPPPLESLLDLRDERTPAATRPINCASCAMGHHSHWIPMRRAGRDPEGTWAVVTRLSDTGLEVQLDSGPALLLGHHDMTGHGDVLANNRRVWLQLKWGWLWTTDIGISVQLTSRWTRCHP